MSELKIKPLMEQAVQGEAFRVELAEFYLTIALGKADWPTHITKLYQQFLNKCNGDGARASNMLRKSVGCAVLLPYKEGNAFHIKKEAPETLLLKVHTYSQIQDEDWYKLFLSQIEKDLEIMKYRQSFRGLGYVERIDFAPYHRQAYNWLYEKAEDGGWITESNKDEIQSKFKNLVQIYGGVVVTNIFVNHKEQVKKVLNWSSGYYFEKKIYEVYSLEEIKKLKIAELKKTNDKLVKGFLNAYSQ